MISVIIPIYKNKELFLKNLENNISYLHSCEIIIVNDDPNQTILPDLIKYKNIIVIENKKNLGFGESINKGVHVSKGEFIMLLNSDIILNNSKFTNALSYFKKDSSLFAVSFAQKEQNNMIVGKNIIYWKDGFIYHKRNENLEFGSSAWAEGGSCLIDKNKFIELGGFDKIYSPFYWEDIDLSYSAWKVGYHILFDPNIQVTHYHKSTIGKYFNQNTIKEIAFRNQLLFNWKHINNFSMKINHIVHLIPTIIKGGKTYMKGFINAIFFSSYLFKFNKKNNHQENVINIHRHNLP